MKYTKAQRLEVANAFRLALQHLAVSRSAPGEEFICHCLSHVHYKTQEVSYWTYTHARDLIIERLQGEFTLYCWIEKQPGINAQWLNRDYEKNDGRKLQKTRKAWLESLIQEFSA